MCHSLASHSVWQSIEKTLIFIGVVYATVYVPCTILAHFGMPLLPDWAWTLRDSLTTALALFTGSVAIYLLISTYVVLLTGQTIAKHRKTYLFLIGVGSLGVISLLQKQSPFLTFTFFVTVTGCGVLLLLRHGWWYRVAQGLLFLWNVYRSTRFSLHKENSFFHWFSEVLDKHEDEILEPSQEDDLSSRPPTVFFCCNHKGSDKRYVEEMQEHLAPFTQDGQLTLWSPLTIPAGVEKESDMQNALRRATIAIIFVSRGLLAKLSTRQTQLVKLLDDAQRHRTLILIIHASSSVYNITGLERFQAMNDPERPLGMIRLSERDKVYVKVATAIYQRMAIMM